MSNAPHWERVYSSKDDSELSWHQSDPCVSAGLIGRLDPAPTVVFDAGGGQSALAGRLVEMGVARVVVMDIAEAAIVRARARHGEASESIEWVVGDVLDARDLGAIDLWHDRAVFHFLSEAGDIERYREIVASAVRPGGHAIIATFAPSGPERCSGLPVRRYSAEGLADVFSDGFTLVDSTTEEHRTPWGSRQDFVYAVLRRSEA